jgi:carbamoyltransferase
MGLAPYGRRDADLADLLAEHISVDGIHLVVDERAAGAFRRLQAYRKTPDQTFEAVADVAHTAQEHFSELLLEIFANLQTMTGATNLVFSGGCALNSSLNGRASAESPFERIFIPPAPSDDGNAVGAALLAWREDNPGAEWAPIEAHSPYLGSRIDDAELAAFVAQGDRLGLVAVDPEDLAVHVASALAAGRIVGWMQGRAEFGPRALGNRSILADPRLPDIKERINALVKLREGFRPFAPAILHDHGDAYFEDYRFSPYMERTMRFRPEHRASLPGVCHVDGTGRAQSVTSEANPRFHRLLSAFHRLTGTPVLLNTSLNVMGKPIVHSIADAMTLYLTSGIDLLVVGDHVFEKPADPSASAAG